jgi:hypothetical protein
MKIIFVKCPAGIGYGYHAGATLDCSEEFATEMINLGYAEAEKKGAKITSALPEDLPGREAFEAAGILTLDAVKEVGNYTEIKGIGKATAENIVKYFSKDGF